MKVTPVAVMARAKSVFSEKKPYPGCTASAPLRVDGVEDRLGVEVALGRGLAPEGIGLVGHADVQGVAVELGVHRHRGDAQLAAGADDPHGDLRTVGDQDLLEHATPFRRGPTTLARPVGWVPCAPTARRAERVAGAPTPSAARGRSRTSPPRRHPLRAHPALRRDRLHQPLPARRGPRRRARGCGGGGRLPDARGGAGSAGAGRRPPGPTCWCRCCCDPALPVDELHLCTVAVALAAAVACDVGAGVVPDLKWPNDLMVGERKLGGILAEALPARGAGVGGRRTRRRLAAVVAGLGLNVGRPADPAPTPTPRRRRPAATTRRAGRC